MTKDPPKPENQLRRRIEDYLKELGCGLRATPTLFEVYNLENGTVIVTFADLSFFAQTNSIADPDPAPDGP